MRHPDEAELKSWIGRAEVRHEGVDQAAIARLAGLLDLPAGVWKPDELPPLGHWLQFLPAEPQSTLSADGHPEGTALLPARPRERRMWAGGRIDFRRAIPFGADLQRRSEVSDIRVKHGASGELVFVTLRHEISADGEVAIREEQDLVYRDPPKQEAPAAEVAADGPDMVDWRERFVPDTVRLFRYSALTYNAHRIHYDRDYAIGVEGYPALVVHGPLIATLLGTAHLRHNPGAGIARFAFRARRPLFDVAAFDLAGVREGERGLLWAIDAQGRIAMTAEVNGVVP
jgi:3-methylfumaryl-CoA hydratase